MTAEGTVTLELDVREARVLVKAANMMGAVFEKVLEDDPALLKGLSPTPGVSPLRSGAMKLETAMVLVGAEL